MTPEEESKQLLERMEWSILEDTLRNCAREASEATVLKVLEALETLRSKKKQITERTENDPS